jgi:multisubunit Na+/H+ antiporter MnhG subunit
MEAYPSMATYTKRMTVVIGIASLLVVLGGVAFYRSVDAIIFALGVVITAALNIVKTNWLRHSVSKASDMDPAFAPNYVRGQGMLRMLFTLVVLVGAAFLSLLDVFGFPLLFGAVFGLLTMPVAAYSMAFFVRKDYPQRNEEAEVGFTPNGAAGLGTKPHLDEGGNTDV